jgi:hypothetical protein
MYVVKDDTYYTLEEIAFFDKVGVCPQCFQEGAQDIEVDISGGACQLDLEINGSLGPELDGIQGAKGTFVDDSNGECDRPLDSFAEDDNIYATSIRSPHRR